MTFLQCLETAMPKDDLTGDGLIRERGVLGWTYVLRTHGTHYVYRC